MCADAPNGQQGGECALQGLGQPDAWPLPMLLLVDLLLVFSSGAPLAPGLLPASAAGLAAAPSRRSARRPATPTALWGRWVGAACCCCSLQAAGASNFPSLIPACQALPLPVLRVCLPFEHQVPSLRPTCMTEAERRWQRSALHSAASAWVRARTAKVPQVGSALATGLAHCSSDRLPDGLLAGSWEEGANGTPRQQASLKAEMLAE